MRRLLVALAVTWLPLAALAQEDDEGGTALAPVEGQSLEQVLERGAARFETGPFHAALHGRIQAWGGWVGDDALRSNGDSMQQPGFRLRRARLGVEGGFEDWLRFEVELDAFDQERTGGPLHEAYVDFRPIRYVGAVAGFQKFPFSYSETRSSARLAHLDRSLGTYAMAPSSTMGVVVYGEPWLGHLRVSAGVFNGLQRKPGFHEGYEPVGVTEGNKFERLSYVGRVDLEPLDPVGSEEADLTGSEHPRLGLGGAFFYNDGRSIATMGASGYLHFKWYGAHVFGEVLWDRSKPQTNPTSTVNTIPSEVERLSAQGSLGYVWRKLGVAARLEYLDDNRDLETEGDEIVVAGTVTYYAVANFFKAQVEYQHRIERYGRSLKNDAVIAGVQCAF